MIELRWLEREEPVADGQARTVRVLQFRHRLSSEAWLGVQSNTDYEVAMRDQEWRDVPVVAESE